jgi:hypothetical protein
MTNTILNIAQVPRLRRRPLVSGRKIHLIDIENLTATPRPSRLDVERARQTYENAVTIGTRDHVILASARANLFSAYLGWPKARFLARDGKDGADICLAQVIVDERVANRYEAAVVASGDGGLAPFVAYLASKGMETVVVSRSETLSRKMRLASSKCILLTSSTGRNI